MDTKQEFLNKIKNNIEFVTQTEHLQRHNGNFRNESTGPLVNRNVE